MPVTYLKVQLEFRISGEGFSEIYYHSGSDPKGFKASASALVEERKKLLVAVGTIHHVRVSGAQPGARAYRFPVFNGGGVVASTKTRDVGAVTGTVGLYGNNGAFRKLQLHGLPDDYHTFDTAGNPNPALGADLSNYLTYLQTNAYAIKHTIVSANDAANAVVNDITVAAGVVTFKVNPAGLAVGKKVRISGPKGTRVRQFRGTWTVGALLADGFTSRTTRSIDTNFFYIPGTAKMRAGEPDAWNYEPITGFDDFEIAGSRRVGRPTDSPRGRRSNRP